MPEFEPNGVILTPQSHSFDNPHNNCELLRQSLRRVDPRGRQIGAAGRRKSVTTAVSSARAADR